MIRPNLMRALDRWIGVPLCWGSTLLRRALGFKPAPPQPPRRVLFMLLSESGSMVLADPAIRALLGQPAVEPHFLTFAHNRPALAISGTIPDDRVHTLRADSLPRLLLDCLRWRSRMRALGIDTVVDFELFSRLSALFCLYSGARQRVGFHGLRGGARGCYRGDLYTRRVPYDPSLHIAHNYLALSEALGASAMPRDVLPLPAQRVPAPHELAAVGALLAAELPPHSGQLLLLNPNASDFLPQRRWPTEHYAELANRLLARHDDLAILLIGSAADRATTADIAARVADPRCRDIAGRLALPQLPALFMHAAAMVSNDSGPAHFAAVTELPVVVLFGPETPARYRPLGHATVLSAGLACSPCVSVENQRRTRCRDNRCMREISVESVQQAVEALLAPLARRAAAA